MALCASSDNIPEVGDTVKALQLSDDGEVLWTFFNSGKVLYTHISDNKEALKKNKHLLLTEKQEKQLWEEVTTY